MPQWLHVSDLEGLVLLAEEGHFDFEALLHEKNSQFVDRRFDLFLYERFGLLPFDPKLSDTGLALLQSTGASFWLEDFPVERE